MFVFYIKHGLVFKKLTLFRAEGATGLQHETITKLECTTMCNMNDNFLKEAGKREGFLE